MDDRWSYLFSTAIDDIVKAVKRTRRWRQDGPSLRLLNQHWRQQLDASITSVQPHANRTLAQCDLLSLGRFSNLTSLDLTQFVKPLVGTELLMSPNQFPLSFARLVIPASLLKEVDADQLGQLRGVTSLSVKSEVVAGSQLFKLRVLPLQELSLNSSRDQLHHLEPSLRRLRYLRLKIPYVPLSDLSLLSSLASLDLTCTSQLPYDPAELLNLSCLESLTLMDGVLIDTLSSLAELPRLKHLAVSRRVLFVNGPSWPHQLFSKLESLRLRTFLCDPGASVWELRVEAPELRWLALDGVSIDQQRFILCPRLECLCIEHCNLGNALPEICRLSRLEKLCLCGFYYYEQPSASESIAALSDCYLPKLRALTLRVSISCEGALMQWTAKHSRLEVLGLSFHDCRGIDDCVGIMSLLRNPELLPELRELGIFGTSAVKAIARFGDPAWLSGLEAVWLRASGENSFYRKFRSELLCQDPQLKMNEAGRAQENFMNEHYAHRG